MKKVTIVFTISVIITILFVLWGAFAADNLASVTGDIQKFLQTQFGWFYLIVASVILLFAIYLIFSKYGKIKLGKDDEKPEYGLISWFAMLFSAGMGIGIVFYGVAEPLQDYLAPPYGDPGTKEAAADAMRYSFFHWGLHPWGIYAVIALALAYFKFRKGAPGLISATFYPLLGDKVKGWIGKLIDIIAVLATVFGVATSLGLGAAQINGGLHFISPNIPNSISVQFIIVIIVTVLFILSAVSGLGRGIKWLSNANVAFAIILMLFLLFAGNTGFLLDYFTSTLGNYIQKLPSMSLNISPFDEQHSEWMQNWTLFYWAWWIAWAPFVGTFIARVSKGRTVREFIIGVLVVPTIFCTLWFSIFGGSGMYLERIMHVNLGDVIKSQGTEVALFSVLAHFPLSTITSILAILLISIFFITSADSATFVLGMQTTNGSLNPPNLTKIIWGILVSATALVLLWSGGLTALQTASIIAAFPFAFILIFMMFSLIKSFKNEVKRRK
ncbi:BCCT family transporter [Heyndrickxia sporothermodurans]|uniref:BCCT family transporter n=1 Tax=Heyndrickxia sporothermodurans TaxID=46224 RepID=A0AB37HE41_9BACI|nr:BCCT family transporter [Heyndrickxia sporothermodurans]MBL5767844.1 BCCT family transporter [Heyndrickxia sporothermodurans]MBL5771427.1 BCCT family transporter [Heyndrickxia sporothermodurans]MBL5775103.1 BCCT family transporter [Heyndrickxia sporothermodurans]MBL5778531.1 BCCT family transporter [Heyndrickxia sporothermodurans]MBL5782148.1 BCCT family transporter [Heyndrickxia sporothermodurans]